MSENFYEVLGVGPDATTDQITAAYRDRIKETHPDVSDDEDAEDRAKRVIEAKEVLTDADERARYDRLGHDAYVRRTKVDADWDVTTGTDPVRAAEWATGTGTGSGSDGSTWAGRDERRRGRTGADRADRDGSADPGTGADDVDGAATTSGGRTGSPSGTGGASASADTDGGANRGRTRSTGNVGEAVGWAAGVDGRHAVRHGERGETVRRDRLYPPRDSLVLLVGAFVAYPSLVFVSLFPGFPVSVNFVVGTCTLAVVAYLMSMPEVGAYVFGAWGVLATLVTLGSGFSAFSLLGVVVLGSTWVPFVLSLVVYQVLRW